MKGEIFKLKIAMEDPKTLGFCICKLYEYQTMEEQMSDATEERNGRGFNAHDVKFLSSIARQLNSGRQMSMKQYPIAYKKMQKYAGQLIDIQKQEAKI